MKMYQIDINAIIFFIIYYLCSCCLEICANANLPLSSFYEHSDSHQRHMMRFHRSIRQLTPLLRHLQSKDDNEKLEKASAPDQIRHFAKSTTETARSYHDDYEGMLEALQNELLFIHSAQKVVSKSSPCTEVVDKSTLLLRSIARSSKSMVNLRPDSRTEIAYCASAQTDARTNDGTLLVPPLHMVTPNDDNVSKNEHMQKLASLLLGAQSTPRVTNVCAIDSKCATIFRWKRARIASADFGTHNDAQESGNTIAERDNDDDEEVLVPSGCTCVINALGAGLANVPIIVF